MRKKEIDKTMNVLLGIAAFAILIGAIFKLQHYPYGNYIFYFGFMASFVLSGIEISRLKKIIKSLEEKSKTE